MNYWSSRIFNVRNISNNQAITLSVSNSAGIDFWYFQSRIGHLPSLSSGDELKWIRIAVFWVARQDNGTGLDNQGTKSIPLKFQLSGDLNRCKCQHFSSPYCWIYANAQREDVWWVGILLDAVFIQQLKANGFLIEHTVALSHHRYLNSKCLENYPL